jgi:TolB-like protein/DNA-binding winged helix-turn-helix (wHTH) protein/Tfp pilus assembly protein PilF
MALGAKYRFGLFEMHMSARELSKSGMKIKLCGQPYLILEVLLRRAGEVVTREELRDKLWQADTFVDFEHGLNTSVKKLRQILCDSAETPRYIETVPRLGYRFIAPVEMITEEIKGHPEVPESVTVSAPPEAVEPRSTQSRSSGWRLLGTALAFIALISGAWLLKMPGRVQSLFGSSNGAATTSSRVTRINSIAVLPLENLSGDPGQEYFADGMTDELINDLAQLGALRVISRTSVMHYKGGKDTVPQIGRELGVDALVEGTVERVANRVRIRVQLIETADDRHLWARSYDHELKDVLLLQTTAAHDIAAEIQGQVAGSSADSHLANEHIVQTDVYEAYLKGRYFLNKRTPKGLQQAVKYFQQAVDKDSTYARAYAGLSESYALMGGYSNLPPTEFMPKARGAAWRALELDEQLPEAHSALAFIAENYDWDWQTAEKEYRRAIQLNPNYVTGHHWYAECLALQGRFAEAFPEIERARQLDPLSLIIAADNGAILFFSRQYDRAIQQFRVVLEMEPNFPRAQLLIPAYVQKGQFADAMASAEAWRHHNDSPWNWVMLAYASGQSGDRAKAELALQKLEKLDRLRSLDPLSFTVAYIGVNNKEKALFYLEKAYLEHSSGLTSLKVDPTFNPLRDAPRFQAVARRIGLAE